ncbi:ankyrin repeat-containing domain protein [Mycena epipterygia]|nr:ankyrin repeat-containing domain protein [Mycena epipterygia]
MDPVSAATAVITFGTFAKDLVELFLKVKESIEKVGENNKRLQELTDDILRTLDGLVNLTLRKHDTSQAPALFIALGGLQRQMLHVLEGCREIPSTEASQGRTRHLKSQMKMWWNRDQIEAEIRCLKELTNECYTKFTLFSTARTEEKTVQIANSTARLETTTVQIADGINRIEISSVQIVDTTTRIEDNTVQVQVSVLKQKLETWLQSPPNMAETQHTTQKLHHEGTGGWFLDGNQFGEWRSCPGCLWIEGNSGAGKSVLSSIVIRKLFDDQKSSPGRTSSIGYFYFDFRDEKKQVVEIMLRSIILQLSAQSPKPYTVLEQAYNSSKGQTLPTYQNLLDILNQLLQEFNHTYIILDALDECNEHELVVQLISSLRGQNKGSLHLLFTSQSREIFTAAFDGVPHLLLGPKTTQGDIRNFIASELQSRCLKHWARHTTEITTKVLEKSKGMFRFAACLLVELDTEQVLANLPGDLFEIYDRFLKPIQPSAFPYVERILRWLVCSARPLVLLELEDCLAFDFPDSHQHGVYDPTKRGDYANRVFRAPPHWLENEEDSSRWKQVTLAHTSVAEYLVSRGFAENHRQYDLNQERSHTFLAQTCVGYLLHFTDHPLNSMTFRNYPLSSYAAKYWIYHLKLCHDQALLSTSIMHLLESDSRQYTALNHMHDIDHPWETSPDWTRSIPSPLYICSRIGYTEGVQFLLEKVTNANTIGGQYGSPLQAACAEGYTDIVRLLIQNGADVNRENSAPSALSFACDRGDTETVSLLIEQGAHVNTNNLNYGFLSFLIFPKLRGSPLHIASSQGFMVIVQILLENGADINSADRNHASALCTASAHGQMEMVQFLIENGANANASAGLLGLTALQAASNKGHTEIVEFLIEKGVDVNAAGGKYGNALQAASAGGYTEIVQFLVEKGADINAVGNALQAASIEGHTEIVQFLVEKGVDVNASGGSYGSALLAASIKGHTKIVQFLVENGADINASRRHYGSALQAASMGGQTEIVEFLVKKGADVNASGGMYNSALQAASFNGHAQIVRFLIGNSAVVNAGGGEHGSALQAASSQGHVKIVQFLAERGGADVNASGGNYGSALQTASSQGHVEIVQFLIEKGADVDSSGGLFGSALQAASKKGNMEVVQFLVEKGADVNALGDKYGSALQAASSQGHVKIVQFLVGNGADVNAVGGEYGTALQAAASWNGRLPWSVGFTGRLKINAADAEFASSEVPRFLVENGASVNTVGGRFGSPLHAACVQGNFETVRFLIEKGADICAPGACFGSALQAAVSKITHLWWIEDKKQINARKVEIVHLLLEIGADINAWDAEYGTALQAACASSENDGMVRFLLENGADVNAPGGKDGSAVQIASRKNQRGIVWMLIEYGAQEEDDYDGQPHEKEEETTTLRGMMTMMRKMT